MKEPSDGLLKTISEQIDEVGEKEFQRMMKDVLISPTKELCKGSELKKGIGRKNAAFLSAFLEDLENYVYTEDFSFLESAIDFKINVE